MTRILKTLGMLFLFVAICFHTYAQGRQITGTVTSSDSKQPLQGVTVTVKGTKNSVVTDAQGNYRINVDSKATTLVFTHTSFITFELPINGNTVDAELSPSVKSLDDVVIIGYQAVKRKDLLASVSSISARDLKDIPINSAAEALNGRLAGVTATTSEGSPDATIRIRVRGGMSITQDNSPLYIVDGVQVENALSTLSPQDIQTIDVLKDAAATAIYGARGANGVIIITTKSGKPGRTIINYNAFVGLKELAKELKVLSPYDYVIYQSERSRGSSTDSLSFTNNFGHTWDTLNVYKNIPAVDWQDQVFGRTGTTTTQNISVSGGNKRVVFDFGYTYNGDKAIVINSNYRRHLLNAKAEFNVIDNLKIAVAGRYYLQNVYGAGVSDDKGSSYNRLRNAVKYRPFLSPNQSIDDQDPYADPNVGNGLVLYNPIDLANSEFRHKTTEAMNGTGSLTYTFLKNFTFRSTFGYDRNELTDLKFYDSITPYAITQGGRKPIAGLDTTTRTTITNSNVLSYSLKGFKQRHDIDVLIGEETYDLRTESRNELFKNYPLNTSHEDAFKNTNLGAAFTGYPKLGKTRYTNLSFFGRLNYAYMDKYLFSFNMRADGASKFAPGKQWAYFPAGSVAWRIKKEKFMENVDVISELKIRAGFGTVGNNRIDDYLYLTTFRNDGGYYYGVNNMAVYAYYPNSLVNEDLQWESTVNRNLGFDIGFLKNRINLSVDIYNNTSKNLLLDVPIASTYGYRTQLQNVGKTSNKGWEVQLNATIVQKPKGLKWTADFNISFNRNKIQALGEGQTSFLTQGWSGVSGQPADYIAKVGSPVSAMYGLITAGFYTTEDFNYSPATGVYTLKPGVVDNSSIIGPIMPGSIRFADLNGDNIVDIDHDRTIIGDPNPKATGGLNQQFTYRNWDLSVFMNFSIGNDIYNANKIEFTNGYTNNANLLSIMNDRWKVVTPTGQTAEWLNGSTVYGIPPDQLNALNANAKIWMPIKGAGAFYPTSWAIEDGSFLRINNVTLGYNFPIKKVLGLNKLRLYFTANNLAIITNYSGYDPEVNVKVGSPLTQGLDYSAYPKSRSYIFGINATF